MKLPHNTSDSEKISTLFKESIEVQLKDIYAILATFDPQELFANWFELVRGIDEIINLPLRLIDLNFNFSNPNNQDQFKRILRRLKHRFDIGVAQRFERLVYISNLVDQSPYPIPTNIVDTRGAKSYFQSRRAYYVALLQLIPHINKNIEISEELDLIHYIPNMLQKKGGKVNHIDLIKLVPIVNIIELYSINITTAFHHLFLNETLDDFEIKSYGSIVVGNFNSFYLESFFLTPERLSLLDQLEFRKEEVDALDLPNLTNNQIFAYLEIENTLKIFQAGFKKYAIEKTKTYQELEYFVQEIKKYCIDEYKIVINASEFEQIQQSLPQIKPKLTLNEADYFEAIKTFAPFQKSEEVYVSTVVLMERFIYQTLMKSLIKKRRFQIHSGFVFEDKVKQILQEYEFQVTDIKRINRKEFDLVTIKNNKIYNFQCKNNIFNIANVGQNYIILAKQNKRLVKYYERAILKEVNREHLLKIEIGLDNIEHYVISRFPVVTRNAHIINFNSLESWIEQKFSH